MVNFGDGSNRGGAMLLRQVIVTPVTVVMVIVCIYSILNNEYPYCFFLIKLSVINHL